MRGGYNTTSLLFQNTMVKKTGKTGKFLYIAIACLKNGGKWWTFRIYRKNGSRYTSKIKMLKNVDVFTHIEKSNAEKLPKLVVVQENEQRTNKEKMTKIILVIM